MIFWKRREAKTAWGRLRLNLQFFSQEKTEKATPHKRKETRQKGQVAKSADVTTAVMLLVIFIYFSFFGGTFFQSLIVLIDDYFRHMLLEEVQPSSVVQLFNELAFAAFGFLAPLFLVSFLAAAFGNYIQVGFLFSTEAITPKWERLNPISGFKKIFSWRAAVELFKSLFKIMLIGLLTYLILAAHRFDIVSLMGREVADSLQSVAGWLVDVGLYASVALLFLALFDYVYQRFDFEKNIRMSKQEVKDEWKKTEGDPELRAKRKEKQRSLAMGRMMQEVPQADVVITNPTHFAVALKYERDTMEAPYVVAKGADYLALKLKEIARQNGVAVIENQMLARGLYDQIEVGQTISDEFFKAVAEVLAYVYRLQGKV